VTSRTSSDDLAPPTSKSRLRRYRSDTEEFSPPDHADSADRQPRHGRGADAAAPPIVPLLPGPGELPAGSLKLPWRPSATSPSASSPRNHGGLYRRAW